MPLGRVKWYDKGKGYGFIESPEGDVFFHFSDILMDGFKALAEDQRVSYRLLRTPEGLKAKFIRPMDKRASVRSAARYRTIMQMKIVDGREKEFDKMMCDVPAWVDQFEQDVGLRRIGAWRNGNDAVCLVESEKPYAQVLEHAREHGNWLSYEDWQHAVGRNLNGAPLVMSPILSDEEVLLENQAESNDMVS
jgi:CspA family cold shock protein